MATANDDRRTLDQILSNILGFEDGVSGIVEHLLAIETKEELLHYLSEFLGSDSPAIRDFADQVARFKRNEPLVLETPTTKPPSSRSDPPAREAKVPARPTSSTTSKDPQRAQMKAAPVRNVKSTAAKTAAKPKPQPAANASSAPQDRPPTATSESNAQQPPKPASVPKSRPLQGTNPVKCGCYGRIHPPLTNCLYCGRVACEREGYNFCAYCGYMVEEVIAPPSAEGSSSGNGGDTAAAAAWRHKERLLRYDRDFAARTTVFDDQADYYSQDSAWLTAEERDRAEQQEREKQEELLRKRLQLNLRIR